MSEAVELSASVREASGKGAARAARRAGMVPGIIYGGAEPPLPVSLGYKDIDLRIHHHSFLTTVLTINVDGKPVRVIPRDFQLDPVRDFPLHVDFLRITADSVLTVQIPVHFINEEASPGLKRGGALNIVRHEVEVTCPADDIPDAFVADLTGLEINDSIHISAIKLPDRVTPTITDRDFTVATIAAPAGLKEETTEAVEAEAEAEAEAEGEAEKSEEE